MKRLGGLSRGELVVLALVVAYSLLPLAMFARHVLVTDELFTGAEGPFPADQFQYMAWIRDAPLARNLLDVVPSERVFLHPMFMVSGLALKVGAGIQAALLMWKPVVLLALLAGFTLYVRARLEAAWARVAALALALMFAAPAAPLMSWLSAGSEAAQGDVANLAGEAFPAGLTWGYFPAAAAVGLMPVFLLAAERIAAAGGRRRSRDVALAAVAGALVAWLHPWQGETLLATVAGALILGFERETVKRLLIPAVATATPLAYYFILSRADEAWAHAQTFNTLVGRIPVWAIAAGLMPLALPAVAGIRRTPLDFGERLLVAWPPAVLVVYVVTPSFAQHAFEGVALPLAILAVRGLERLRRPLVPAAALVAVMTVPGAAFTFDKLRDVVHTGQQAYYLDPGEKAALDHLAEVGGTDLVLASPYLTTLVPAFTGHTTWAGHPSWTPDFGNRIETLGRLFAGALDARQAKRVLRTSGARFLIADCRHEAAALRTLKPLLTARRQFGCAATYRVKGG